MGHVVELFIAPKAGAPMASIRSVTAIAGVGLEGDRYATGLGNYSDDQPGRHITLIASEAIAAAKDELDGPVLARETRRNIVTRDIDLTSLLGTRFRVGDVTCVGVRTCPPCTYLDGLIGRRVLDALRDRGGIRADIVEGGTIRVGDAITLPS